jgi:dTDP-4-dehydrorhamnose reductase
VKILVTGCNGLLGQKLIALLTTLPEVKIVATARTPLAGAWNVPFDLIDIAKPDAVERVASHNPDVIIHAAAMTQVDVCEQNKEACYQTNVVGVEHMIEAARQCGAHLVHVSTDFVFDGEQEMLREEDTPNPVNYYGSCKWIAEQRVMASGVSYSIVRTVLVYGIIPGVLRSNIITWVKSSLEEGKRIQVVNDQWRTPTLAEDLAQGCYLAAAKRAQGIFHLSGKDYLSVYGIAMRAANFFHLDASLINPIASANLQQPARRPPRTGFNIDKARRELGFEPRSLDEGLVIVSAQM